MDNNLEMKIYPNPSLGDFTISFNDSKKHNLEITNLKGKRLIYVEDIVNEHDFNFKHLKSGIYHITILPENITYQIVKQ